MAIERDSEWVPPSCSLPDLVMRIEVPPTQVTVLDGVAALSRRSAE
ncbi:hypothetical protein [Mycolicibacterium mageritense]|nr:hypothetical protein [Mycolicibacterium mageritense]